jgi:transcriptional regulator with XRE-family HTH domain
MRHLSGSRAAEFAAELAMDICERLGAQVRAAREEAGMPQAELARRVGLSRPSVANLEAGRQDITASRLAMVARALDLDLDVAGLVGAWELGRIAEAPLATSPGGAT